ncbi:MAG: hypothetical protein KU28_03550 [Sulfurovum sp. PC08-66]|nr:MAG: hypothetical protein KU28_03550 [Sulfurovum sp. PC08-66]
MKYSVALLSALSALTITSCGGGGGSSTTTPETPNNQPYTGYFVDEAVKGATYICGDKTGTTDAEGKFECPTQEVTFKIGQTVLGTIKSIPADGNVFPQDIVGVDRNDTSHPQVKNMAILMQSLDSDQDPSNSKSSSLKKPSSMAKFALLLSSLLSAQSKLINLLGMIAPFVCVVGF